MKKLLIFITIVLTIASIWNLAIADFYVIPTGTRYQHPDVVSAYGELTPGELRTMMTIPAGKTFILTDVVSPDSAYWTFMENDSIKSKVRLEFNTSTGLEELSIHFKTGIPFAPETQVKLENAHNEQVPVTITGYLIDS
ncbi:MAG: hypothetical protein JSW04_09340 [Desulfobacterales bacterium]|nr:MAG: hypothetical protein JSW04_09340 [Desulfobacterales bacterium]